MPTKTNSAKSPTPLSARRSKKPKTTRLGRSLVKGMKQVLAHVRGEIQLEGYSCSVRRLRAKADANSA